MDAPDPIDRRQFLRGAAFGSLALAGGWTAGAVAAAAPAAAPTPEPWWHSSCRRPFPDGPVVRSFAALMRAIEGGHRLIVVEGEITVPPGRHDCRGAALLLTPSARLVGDWPYPRTPAAGGASKSRAPHGKGARPCIARFSHDQLGRS